MTNRASAERESLIHQHQAETRVLRPVGIPRGRPHYIPAADVRRLQGPRRPMILRHWPNRRHKWQLWASKEIYRRLLSATVITDVPWSCSSATEWSYFIRRFSAYSLIRLIACVSPQLGPRIDFMTLLKVNSVYIDSWRRYIRTLCSYLEK